MNAIASLPMYNPEFIHDATNEWWQSLRRHLLAQGIDDAPDVLTLPDDILDHWRSDNLLLSQTCGYPLTHALKQHVRYLINPVYSAKGCDGPYYRSALIVRINESGRQLNDFTEKRLAINSKDSQSGYNCLHSALPQNQSIEKSFSEIIASGSHLGSIKLVQENIADVCAVDCVTLALAAKHQSELIDGLRILDWTPPTPGLPLITSLKTTEQTITKIVTALNSALADESLRNVRDALLIHGFVKVNQKEFLQ